jgi:hypothetical protein
MKRVLSAGLDRAIKACPKISGTKSAEANEASMDAVVTIAASLGLNYFSFLVLMLSVLVDQAALWFQDTRSRLEEFPVNVRLFVTAFKVRFCNALHFKSLHTRQKFIRRQVKQGKQSIDAYYQSFMHDVHAAGGMSDIEQVTWFLSGLQQELAAECATDREGRPWQSMRGLLDFARGAELRAQAAANVQAAFASGAPRTLPNSAHSQARSASGSPAKKKTRTGPKASDKIRGAADGYSNKYHMSNADVKRFMDAGSCFNCGRLDHLFKDCSKVTGRPYRKQGDPVPQIDYSSAPPRPPRSQDNKKNNNPKNNKSRDAK